MNIDEWCKEIHAWAVQQGFYSELHQNTIVFETYPDLEHMWLSERVALMHEECTEVLGAIREGDKEHESEELADVVIRAFDYAAFRGFSLEEVIEAKMEINKQRPYRHGKKVF